MIREVYFFLWVILTWYNILPSKIRAGIVGHWSFHVLSKKALSSCCSSENLAVCNYLIPPCLRHTFLLVLGRKDLIQSYDNKRSDSIPRAGIASIWKREEDWIVISLRFPVAPRACKNRSTSTPSAQILFAHCSPECASGTSPFLYPRQNRNQRKLRGRAITFQAFD